MKIKIKKKQLKNEITATTNNEQTLKTQKKVLEQGHWIKKYSLVKAGGMYHRPTNWTPYLRRPFIKKINGEYQEFADRKAYKKYLYEN